MRHAARLPPPPIFDDRRLVQLIAFCKLQFIDQSFGVCVCCFCFTLAYLCRYLYILDVCCQFASCQAMLAICKSYCKISPKCIKNNAQNRYKFIPIPSQINQNGAKEPSESDLESKSVPRASPQEVFGAFLEQLGRCGSAFCAQLGAKGLPKSSFLASSRIKISKNEILNEALEKACVFD